MSVFDDGDEAGVSPKPKGMWGTPELEETPAMKAVLKGFDTIGQP